MTNSPARRLAQHPIVLLIALNILIALLVYRDYGLSWDEPLFYDYSNALGYAYSPREWFSGHFDLENSYGASAEDHKTRGPAYLLLARNVVYAFQAFGSDSASAWHLTNLLFFQLGVYFLYRLATRWLAPFAALAASAFFSWQPLLWGHAFINPKDPPFLVFFLGAVCLGFEMVDNLANGNNSYKSKLIVSAFCLGIATSIRVLGPVAGVLVGLYGLYVFRTERREIVSISRPLKKTSPALSPFVWTFLSYTAIAAVIMVITWPYLWENPLGRFAEVLKFMSDNPTQLSVLFNGEIFRADNMPLRYLPFMLGATLTEPTWFLLLIGIAAGYWKLIKRGRSKQIISLTLTVSWFVLVVIYVIVRQPAVYDGLRHFLFILPPIFIGVGFAFEWIGIRFSNYWLRAGVAIAMILPGVLSVVQLHPYEYTYYNSFIGGTSGAFRKYETDFWLTCYKEAVETMNDEITGTANLFVHREAYIAEYYAADRINVLSLRDSAADVQSGDYILVNTRSNEDRSTFREAPPVLQVSRGDAIFCVIKQAP